MIKRIAAVIGACALFTIGDAKAVSMTAFAAETITVTTTATTVRSLLATAGGTAGQLNAAQCFKLQVPTSGVTVYVGASDVTAAATANSRAYPISAGSEVSIPASTGIVFLRVAAATQVVHVMIGNNC